jgi:DNA-binding FadR family transcriptional regulator
LWIKTDADFLILTISDLLWKRSLKQEHKYIQVAGGIEQMIHEEVFRIGDKLPSVRVLSEEYGISMGTAFRLIITLEGKGAHRGQGRSRVIMFASTTKALSRHAYRYAAGARSDVK